MNKITTISILSFILTACTVGPDFEKPMLPVQDNFQGIEGYEVTEIFHSGVCFLLLMLILMKMVKKQ